MANGGTGENIGSVLAGALSQGVSAIPGALQQERQQTLDNIITTMNLQRQIQAEEIGRQQIDLNTQRYKEGVANLQLTNLKLQEAIRLANLTSEQRQQEKIDALNLGLQTISDFSLTQPPGTRISGDGFSITTPRPAATQTPTPKTLSEKDSQVRQSIFASYPDDIANRRWQNYLQNRDPSGDAKEAFDRYLSQNVERGLFGGKIADNQTKAIAAKRSGWSPVYNGTKDDVIDGLNRNLKAGALSKEDFDKYIVEAERHFDPDNIAGEVLDFLNAEQ